MELPVYYEHEACRTCGACCMTAGKAPFEEDELVVIADRNYSFRRELAIHGTGYIELDDPKRDTPCPYLDRQAKTCMIYDTRPSVCRTFEVGGELCIDFRKLAGIKPHDPLEE